MGFDNKTTATHEPNEKKLIEHQEWEENKEIKRLNILLVDSGNDWAKVCFDKDAEIENLKSEIEDLKERYNVKNNTY